MQNLNLNTAMLEERQTDGWGTYAIETSSLKLVWTKYESYILHSESLRLCGWNMKAISYILQQSCTLFKS